MAFTSAQRSLILADIIANPADLGAWVNNADGNIEVAKLYNAEAVPTLKVWRTDAPVSDIVDAIDFSKYTPTDAPEITGMFTARALAIQTKQINLQTMIQGRDTINAAKANVRAGLRDAVIALPAGTGGAAVSAGGTSGVNVLNACTRNATRLEKLLSTGAQVTGTVTADVMGWEGMISYNDLLNLRANS